MEWLSPVEVVLDGADLKIYCGRCYGQALLAQSIRENSIVEGYICGREGHALSRAFSI